MPPNPGVLKLHPKVISQVLTPERSVLEPNPEDPRVVINPEYNYDVEVLRMMLGSIPLPIDGLAETIDSRSNMPTAGRGLNESLRTLRFGGGAEGELRSSLNHPRYDSPGQVWVMTTWHYDSRDKRNVAEIGLVPLEVALEMIDVESTQRLLPIEFPDTSEVDFGRRPVRTEVNQVLVLPETISRYMSELQIKTRSERRANHNLDINEFRNQYFNLDPSKPDLSPIFKQIRGEMLGRTTWGSIVALDVLMRAFDLGVGSIPFLGSLRDSLQSITGNEFVIPGMERVIRHILQKWGYNLPENMFKKPLKGRLMEIADTVIGLSTSIGLLTPAMPAFFVALAAKVPIDLFIETGLLLDKLEQSRKTFGPLNKISRETGTQPGVIKLIEKSQERLNVKKLMQLVGDFLRRK